MDESIIQPVQKLARGNAEYHQALRAIRAGETLPAVEPPMTLGSFPAPTDQHTIPNIGTVQMTSLPIECRRRDLERLQGTIVDLGGRPFRVRGVESRCVENQHKGWPIGLLGEYVEA